MLLIGYDHGYGRGCFFCFVWLQRWFCGIQGGRECIVAFSGAMGDWVVACYPMMAGSDEVYD